MRDGDGMPPLMDPTHYASFFLFLYIYVTLFLFLLRFDGSFSFNFLIDPSQHFPQLVVMIQ
jgi:hypothetical protein